MIEQIKSNFNFNEFLCEKLLKYFKKYITLDQIEVEKLYLGIMIMELNISEMMIIFIISIFIGITKDVLLFSIMFAPLRLTAAGVHCKSNLGCVILTTFCYIGSSYIAIKYPINMYLTFMISIISTMILYKYSPADTKNRPILGEEHRRKLKIKTTIIASILICINLLLLNKILFNLTMFALIIETLSVLPCIYKIMKASYNNYKNYQNV